MGVHITGADPLASKWIFAPRSMSFCKPCMSARDACSPAGISSKSCGRAGRFFVPYRITCLQGLTQESSVREGITIFFVFFLMFERCGLSVACWRNFYTACDQRDGLSQIVHV